MQYHLEILSKALDFYVKRIFQLHTPHSHNSASVYFCLWLKNRDDYKMPNDKGKSLPVSVVFKATALYMNQKSC